MGKIEPNSLENNELQQKSKSNKNLSKIHEFCLGCQKDCKQFIFIKIIRCPFYKPIQK
jgi:hypothetical protein